MRVVRIFSPDFPRIPQELAWGLDSTRCKETWLQAPARVCGSPVSLALGRYCVGWESILYSVRAVRALLHRHDLIDVLALIAAWPTESILATSMDPYSHDRMLYVGDDEPAATPEGCVSEDVRM